MPKPLYIQEMLKFPLEIKDSEELFCYYRDKENDDPAIKKGIINDLHRSDPGNEDWLIPIESG